MSALGACTIVALAFVLMVTWQQLLATAVAMVRIIPFGRDGQNFTAEPLFVGVATALGIGCSLWIGKAWYDPNLSWRNLLMLNAVHVRALIISVVFGISFQFPLTELQNLCERIFPIELAQKQALFQLVSPTSWPKMVTTVFALVLIAPVFEELLFRGFIMTRLYKSSGRFQALLLSSALFGLCHIRVLAALIPACIAGVFLGMVALRSRSTWPSITAHAAINAAPLLLSERAFAIPGFNTFDATAQHVPLPFLMGGSILSMVALVVLMFGADSEQSGER